ncbi:MAG: nicotinate (nicotinamide) nucleotide adenylyltransferase [Chloroflexi bacterium]|nr:nicotinate (nicotinamide) nucleotide adenylyltransferase [Chloroflexota bacterium]
MNERIGIFGGTFDPPHLGHLILASESRAQLNLTRLLFVLTPTPPHKLNQPVSSIADRLAMLRVALKDEPAFELSMMEMERPGPHYTLDTVQLLTDKNRGADLILLLGGDSLRDLPTWHRPADLVAACRQIGVMRRPGDSIELSALERQIPGVTAKVKFVEAPLLEIASREIRRRASSGRPFRYYLLPSVYNYIVEHKLYQKP